MKSLYLILAATAVVVTSEPQRNNNDIIWYPVDDEEGVFISTLGEKHRTPQDSKWRSHRRARYSGSGLPVPLPLSYDPTENHDPSFFHNINDRNPSELTQPIPKVPPAFLNQQFPVDRPNRFQSEEYQNYGDTNFQEILNEVFDYQKPGNEFPPTTSQWGSRPVTENQIQWGGGNQSPITSNQNQWGSGSQRPVTSTQNQWGSGSQRPVTITQNQWGSGSQRPVTSTQNQWGSGGQRPLTSNQNQWGGASSRPAERPTNAEWFITPSNTNRPSRRPTTGSDKLVFPGETAETTTTASDVLPTEAPTMSPCERNCPVTPEFNPVCGSDGVTYSNAGRLKCSQMCGKNVRLSHHGNCGRTPLVTPLLPNNPKKFRAFF